VKVGRAGRAGRLSEGAPNPIKDLKRFLTDYITLPEGMATVIAAWVAAAWLSKVWDRFPHLAITSPEKRCGKSTLLDILAVVVPKPLPTSNISPAALYRVIQLRQPTLLLDEAQSLVRRGSEAAEVIREILNAGISKTASVIRCSASDPEELMTFHVYSPKVFAMIGQPDAVLADRCLPVVMKRKTSGDKVERYRSRVVEARGQAIRQRLSKWAARKKALASDFYEVVEPFEIENDRMADLLLPLQCVLHIVYGKDDLLKSYALSLDDRERQQEAQSPGVRLLGACRDLFRGEQFISTPRLIAALKAREEEPWGRWNRGSGLNAEALATLLRTYKIKPQHNKQHTRRGYYACDFQETWDRYLPPSGEPSGPSSPSRQPRTGSRRVSRGVAACPVSPNTNARMSRHQRRVPR
jgi:hypothetical protein